MGGRWPVERVVALAPDASSAAGARTLADPARWTDAGATDGAVWGRCRGSGTTPYATVVDLTGPAFQCSCPSRKLPCKHALGLLLLWASDAVPARKGPADFASAWLVKRQEPAREKAPVDPVVAAEQAAARRAKREDNVAAGMVELQQWVRDQVRAGIASAERSGYGEFDRIAARMVDAQAPGVAGTIRRLPAVAHSGNGWPDRLLSELARLDLLAEAFRTIGSLDDDLAATVRAHVGINVPKEVVLQRPAVADHWVVLGRLDRIDANLSSRRTWLRGVTTGRTAVVITFAAYGQTLDGSLVPGTAFDADLHQYPGAAPLRALVGEIRDPAAAFVAPRGATTDDALAARAAALAEDPWTRGWPALLDAVRPARTADGAWALADDAGALPLAPDVDPWPLLAESGGHPVRVLVEVARGGSTPVAVVRDDAVVPL